MNNTTEFGQFIRKKREELGLTLRAFAKELDLSPTFISELERGISRCPSEENIIKMANLLDVEPNKLITLAGKIPNEFVPDILTMIGQNPDKARTILKRTIEEGENDKNVQS